jgi:hypothetical protein
MVASACYLAWSGSMTDLYLGFAVVALAAAVVLPLGMVTPPTVLFLAISDYDQFHVLKSMQSRPLGLGDLLVLSLINQRSEGVIRNYDDHYRQAGTIARKHSVLAWAVPGALANPGAPHSDSLRTRPGRWRETLEQAIDLTPIVVLDTRDFSRYVLEEALCMLDPERVYKCLFLVRDDGAQPVLDRVRAFGFVPGAGVQTVTEDELIPRLRELTRSPAALPRRSIEAPTQEAALPLAEAQRRFEAMTARLEDLVASIGAKNGADPELDARISAWDQAQDSASAAAAAPPYTASLDAALELVQRHLSRDDARCSYTIAISIDGLADVSIGLQSRPGNMRIFKSDGWRLGAPRAMLQAFYRALLS